MDIREQLPEYQTPSGRIRERKSVIGRIHGVHDSSTGIVDIAMVGSLCKKEELHPRLQEYGLVIMDDGRDIIGTNQRKPSKIKGLQMI